MSKDEAAWARRRAILGLCVSSLLMGCSDSDDLPCSPARVRPAYSDALCLAGALPAGDDDWARSYRRFVLEKATAAGVRTFRDDFTWSEAEPERGRFNFAAQDARMDDLTAAGAREIGLITYGNPWASAKGSDCARQDRGNCAVYPADDPDDYARFAAALAERYRATVSDWEIWNEQNSGFRFWVGSDYPWKYGAGTGGDPDRYGELLGRTYKAIKAVHPKSAVAYGGLFYHEQFIMGAERFLDLSLMHRPDLGRFFDVLAYHPYTTYPPQVPPEAGDSTEIPLVTMQKNLENVMAIRGTGTKEVWVTEVGWPVYGQVDEERQAQYLVRSAILAMSAGATRVCWFTFQDGPEFRSFPPEQAFGVFRYANDRTSAGPKPAYDALTTMSARLEGTRYTCDLNEELGLGADGYAFLFEGRGKRVLVAWASSADSQVLSMDLLQELFRGTILGVRAWDREDDARNFPPGVSIPLSGSPVFVSLP
ncbi:MAG: hypothetical protein HYT87_03295 [Nitrospirae bacterium]|nr:hypothetical protein [Nitrospirota bacterium]